ncbi:GNAT family N-acetyltransferase [Nocardioides sp.]|uniref:GNAT family N-acetyltransferase n=1 Tax=Nocardioides sp. TaxID=35761 RepID=UPI00273509C3|nr:GNAT family N-acetyltransferase [Nocardioides sp.]MDP3891212.1 GNAT family N-acetyltransferase [Nocardioides sp.]
MIPDDNRFESDHEQALPDDTPLPAGWEVGGPDPEDPGDVDQLATLLHNHEAGGRGWGSSGADEVLVEISEHGIKMRENLVIRDPEGSIRAWGSVHDRAAGRMMFIHIVDRDLTGSVADRCSTVLFDWAEAQARQVGEARGFDPQQIDTGAFADDERQHKWLENAGFNRVRTWWQMSRPVTPDEASLVPSPDSWENGGVVIRLVEREGSGMPDENDLRALHEVIEGAFTDHFNHREETFTEIVHRLLEDPGHRWDHWWLAEILDSGTPQPAGALVGSLSVSDDGPNGSYVDYIGVLSNARGRGVAKGLLRTIIADAAARGRNRVGLEVDADSPTGADGLYTSMGWETRYVTESWHKDIPVQ